MTLAARARFAALAILGTFSLAVSALAQDTQLGDELYRPRLRQPGKDVMWLPTPDAMVTRMLEAARTTRDDVVYDLGAGDGRIPIAAARSSAPGPSASSTTRTSPRSRSAMPIAPESPTR